ncbi:LytTR family DNA-binding domain-containing protein [Massilia sp.]|uniref:LytR/AlgR family response regulator transcription factor n=1 Tax=Massilia sp. TaxID=1882437 RepID=UPI0028B0561B|nr:LytTR family DNA-binding domain-containing protein [Massilia sp.]
MRALIVDDEAPARARLRRLLQLEGVAEVLEACDAAEARTRLAAGMPDVVFLDIRMPGSSGMELAASLAPPRPQVVFTTAFDAYAVAAFDTGAADYLLKPFDGARLRRALERVRARLAAQAPPQPPAAQPAHLLVPGRGGTAIVPVSDIGWVETADNYVILHTRDAQPLLRRTLAALLAELGPGFVRCHRRAAVQVAWIERVLARPHGDCSLQLRGGAMVPCSRQHRAGVMAALGCSATPG